MMALMEITMCGAVKIIVYLVLFTNCYLSATTTENISNEERLKKDLLKNYDVYSPPNDHELTDCAIALVVNHFEIDEEKSRLNIYGYMHMTWHDQKLMWRPADYGRIHEMHLSAREVWKPVITLYNSESRSYITSYVRVILQQSGTQLWAPPVKISVFCNFDLTYWPYDKHTCQVVFMAWSTSGDMLNLKPNGEKSGKDIQMTSLDPFINNRGWELLNITTQKSIVSNTFHGKSVLTLGSNLTFRRTERAYKTFLTPAIFVSTVSTLSSFCLSPHERGKLILNGLSMLIMSLYLLNFAIEFPFILKQTPLVVRFFVYSLGYMSLSMVEAVTVIFLTNSTTFRPLPRFVVEFLNKCYSWLAFSQKKSQRSEVSNPNRQGTRSDQQQSESSNENKTVTQHGNNREEYIKLAVIMDRVFFFSYCILFIYLALSHL